MQARQLPPDGTPMRGPNGESGVVRNGQIVILAPPSPNSVTMRPADPTLPTRQAILEEQLRMERLRTRQLSEQLGPEQTASQSTLTGADYLATLPPADQRMVRALSEGRIQVPSGRALTTGNWQRWIEQAQQYDPALDAANARTRYMTRREYTSGVQSRNVIALNTALGHIDSLAEAADALDNGTWPLVNRGRNAIREFEGDPRINNFNLRRQAVADELEKVFRGTGGSVEGVRGWQQRLNAAQSPEQLHGALEGAADLLNSRLHAVADSYDRAMGRSDAHMDWLSPHAGATMARYGFSEWGTGDGQGQGHLRTPPAGPSGPSVQIEGTTATREPGMDATTVHSVTPGGEQARELTSGTDLQIDPVLRTVGRHLGRMIAGGRPDSEILDYARSAGADPSNGNLQDVLRWRRGERVPGFNGTFRQWQSQNPHSAYPLGESFYTRDVPQAAGRSGTASRVISSLAQSPVGSYAAMAGNALLGNRLDDVVGLTGGNAEQARAGLQAMRDQHPLASLAGDISGAGMAYAGGEAALSRLGGTAAARFVPSFLRNLGTAGRARLGDAAYGLYSGTGDNYGDAPLATLLNVGGGMFGRSLTRGGGRLLTGARDSATRLLTESGIPLTIGQMAGQGGRAGQILRGIEDRLSGLPIVGSFIKGQQRQGVEGFNRAAFREGLTPIGADIGPLTGAPAVDAAQVARSNAYSSALDPVTVNMDPQFRRDYRDAVIAGNGLPEPMGSNIRYTLPTRIENSFSPTGELTGRDFQQSIRGLRRDANAVANQPYGYDFGQVTQQGENALEGLLARQSPGTLPAYRAANTANRNVEILRDAVDRARKGTQSGTVDIFTPAQLTDAAAASSRRFGNTQGTTRQPFFDLTRAGQQILPNRIPDSGTAGRWLLPAALVGGGAASDETGLTDHATKLGLALSALSLPYTNVGRSALQTAIARRPDWARNLGEAVLNNPRLARRAGMFAAPIPGYYGLEDNY